MEGNSSKGRGLAMAVGIYSVIKTVLNGIIGGFSVSGVLLAIVILALMVLGIRYSNYVVAALMAVVVVQNFAHNISDIGANWIYLLEAVIDIAAAAILCFSADVKAFFAGGSSDGEN